MLYHTLPGGQHWDLGIEAGETLATWQVFGDPTALTEAGEPIAAKRIGDHRRAYLDYEGPVSGNRGQVKRIDRGSCRLLDEQPDRWVFHLAGSIMIGTYKLAAATHSAGEWTLHRLNSSEVP